MLSPHLLIVPLDGRPVLVTRAMERVTIEKQVRAAEFRGHSDSETAADLAARAHFERALELDPDDTESADAVRELDGRLSIPDALSMGPDKRDSLAALSTVPKPRLGRPLTPDHSGDGRRARRSGDDSIAPVPGAENLDQILDQARGMTGSDLQLPTPNASTASPRLGDDLTNSIGRHEGARVPPAPKDG